MDLNLPFFYPILDYDYASSHNLDPISVITEWISATDKIPFIQLRGKSLNESSFADFYHKLSVLFPDINFILNDFWQLAIQFRTGFHIGKEDYESLSVKEKEIVKNYSGIKGTSSHSIEDLGNLENFWNYSGLGPIFPTKTKISSSKFLGTEIIPNAVDLSSVPIVAIGGITLANYQSILDTRPVSISGISSFMAKGNCKKFHEIFLNTKISKD